MKCKHCGLVIYKRKSLIYQYAHYNGYVNCRNARDNWSTVPTKEGTYAEPFEFKDYLKQAEDVASSKG